MDTTSSKQDAPLFCVDGKPHCFHQAEPQDGCKVNVPGGVHADEACCWCECRSCRSVLLSERYGHGRFAPESAETSKSYSHLAIEAYGRLAKKFVKNPLHRKNVELLQLLAHGTTETAVAKKWCVTLRAVTYRQARIKKKLGAKTMTEAVAIAVRNRFVE